MGRIFKVLGGTNEKDSFPGLILVNFQARHQKISENPQERKKTLPIKEKE
jgi:hypothetical protein